MDQPNPPYTAGFFFERKNKHMSGLFGSPPPPPKPPKPQPPAPMPNPEAPEILEAKRQAALKAIQRGGRDSTILTDSDKRASGADYSRRTLGGA